jgi:hypothetical protein
MPSNFSLFIPYPLARIFYFALSFTSETLWNE